jgi:hypothetical protein
MLCKCKCPRAAAAIAAESGRGKARGWALPGRGVGRIHAVAGARRPLALGAG